MSALTQRDPFKEGLCRTAAVLAALLLAGCGSGPKSGKGLYLPEGNIEKGKTAFVQLKCNECHRVSGVAMAAPTSNIASNVVLGGEVTRLQTHGELVTAIINPSHGFAQGFNKELAKDEKISPMRDFNDQMTVQQLIDLVAFVQSRYKLIDRDYGRNTYEP